MRKNLNCKRCGICCKSTFFALRDVPIENDVKEIGRWMTYHNITTMKYPINNINYLAINLPNPCRFLEEKVRKYNCIIYKNRPKVCKDYWCSNCGK